MNKLIKRYIRLKDKFDKAKKIMELEKRLRNDIIDYMYDSPAQVGKLEKKSKNGAITIEVNRSLTYKIDGVLLNAVQSDLEEAGIDVQEIVSFSPKLILKSYKKLNSKQQKLLNTIITTQPSSATLKIKVAD